MTNPKHSVERPNKHQTNTDQPMSEDASSEDVSPRLEGDTDDGEGREELD